MDDLVWHKQGKMGESEMIYLGLGLIALVFVSIFFLFWRGDKEEP